MSPATPAKNVPQSSKPAPATSAVKSALSPQETVVKKSRDKAASFKTLATKRTNKALKALSSVGSLANRNSYTFDAPQVEKITAALTAALALVVKKYEKALTGENGAATNGFEL